MGRGSMSGKRSTRWKRVRAGVIAFLVLANVAVAYTVLKVDAVQDAIARTVVTIPDVAPVLDIAPAESSDPMTVLVIGSDSRENLPDDWAAEFGSFAGARADVIMLVRVLPGTGELSLLSIPRDLLVQIEGYGQQKVNAAYAFGGAPLMITTLRDTFGIPIHHYAEVDFVGFAGLVDELGGIAADFSNPSRDLKSGLSVEAGPQVLDGRTALAYARSRSFQEYRDGQWISAGANDIGRTGRQQQLVLSMFQALKSPTTLAGAEELVASVAGYVAVDAGLLKLDLLSLAFDFRSISSESMASATLPTVSELREGIWYEIATQPEADQLISQFSLSLQGSAAPLIVNDPLALGDVPVTVVNGGGVPGAATTTAELLAADGFAVDRVDNAATFDTGVTLITVPEGAESLGDRMVDLLGVGSVRSDPEARTIIVLLGKDIEGL